ncbi:MAG: AAA family ATPase [Actinobacteria bacterium]|nr:AAA family ATPase [Actinomycetota bacterium]MCG2790009.1 AAA family ATPase [Actinomycetes bacterium]
MKTILLATKNKNLIDNVNNITDSKYSIVCLDDLKLLRHYTEEFMPSYLIISSDLEDFKNAVHYINNNTNCEVIVTGTERTNVARGNLFINDFNKIEDLDKVLRIIDNMENEIKVSDSREIKFINQQVISFFSVQGGAGKTSLAFNFAWYLKNLKNIKILLIDLNFAQGPSDLTSCLNLPVIPNLSLFIEKISQGYEALAESVVSLSSLNIDILQPPLTLHQSDKFDVDMLGCLIYLGRNNYNFIIADIPFRFDNICIEMLNLSTISLLVLNPNSGTIIRANEFKRLLPQYQKKGIVVNNMAREQNYSIKDLKSLLDIPIFEQIPHICEKEICYLKYGKRNLKIVDLQSKILNLASQII